MRKCLWFALLALFLFAAYGMADFDAVSGTSLPIYSCRRHDPFGSSALRELLAARGRTVELLERPVPAGDGAATLILMAPAKDLNLDTKRARRLLDWVGRGNQLLLLSRARPAGLRQVYAAVEIRKYDNAGEMERLERNGEYREALARYAEPHAHYASMADGSDADMLLADPAVFSATQSGGVDIVAEYGYGAAVLSLPWEAGNVTLVGSPSPALNAGIALADNADVLLSLVRHDTVFFDEYSLGLGREHSFMEWLRRAGLIPLLAQGALALLLLARSGDSDFGGGGEEPAASASAEEQIRLLADLYQRTLSDDELDRHLGEQHEHQHLRRRQK